MKSLLQVAPNGCTALRSLLCWELGSKPAGAGGGVTAFFSAVTAAASEWRRHLQDECGFKLYAALQIPQWLIVATRALCTVAAVAQGSGPGRQR